ncbi:hypothetical protein [Kitasatospora phosalacinea]|uniref:Uncharacterized protein n=1 Tax=Kitasatospora phosalacinea TaxID=2065 RepID=A0A9W6PC04_9ACTN|nr:hypothetical protein [Kitasatospora phosalacinea]GLW52188.1 hypothetical protein Kpho01_01990 [Kitasatospora phosalacinea]
MPMRDGVHRAADAFHLPVGRPVTRRIHRDAAHPSRLGLPCTAAGTAQPHPAAH